MPVDDEASGQFQGKFRNELAGDPKAMVQHLIMTGQVSNPILQRIMPMIQKLGGR